MRDKVLDPDYYKNKFIEKSNKRHNFKYNYSKVKYVNSTTKVEIICSEHGSFFVRPDAHVRKVGCPSCNGGIKYTKYDFIKKAKQKHNNYYNYEKVDYINSSKKVIINCPKHGDFYMAPANHLIGQKCPSCSGVKQKTTKDFIIESIIIHNNKYSYEMTNYKNNRNKVIIECPEHGFFEQNPKDHLKGHGCPKCSNHSKGEEKIEKILNNLGIYFIREYKFDDCLSINKNKLPFDFYLPDFNTIIEFDGRQHFEPVSVFGGEEYYNILKENDKIRNEWCLMKKINLIRVSYLDDFKSLIDNLNTIVNKKETIHRIFNRKRSKIEVFDLENKGKVIKTKFNLSKSLKIREDIFEYLKNKYNGIIKENYKIDETLLDFYLEDINLGIIILNKFRNSEINSEFRKNQNTSNLENIKVVHIFEDLFEKNDTIIKSRINNLLNINEKIFARKCKVVEIDTKTCGDFLTENHIQGKIGSSIKLGLEYNNEIVSVMTFGKLRKNLGSVSKDDYWELIRFCNKINTNVIGGASKLFNFFIKRYNPEKVISYADRCWSTKNNVYEKIGMKLESGSDPSYYYLSGSNRIGRFSFRKDQLISFGYSKDMTEKSICFNNEMYRIYDCGTFKYIWKN
jgi:very-short-patch-repair endonuclease